MHKGTNGEAKERDSPVKKAFMQVGNADAAETHSAKVFDAMGAGALDVVKIPCVDGSNGAGAFVSKIDPVASLIGTRIEPRQRTGLLTGEPAGAAVLSAAAGPISSVQK